MCNLSLPWYLLMLYTIITTSHQLTMTLLFGEGSIIELESVLLAIISTNQPLFCAMMPVLPINTQTILILCACHAIKLATVVLLLIPSLLALHARQHIIGSWLLIILVFVILGIMIQGY